MALQTKAQKVYLGRFIIRCVVFLGTLYMYIFKKDSLDVGDSFFDLLPNQKSLFIRIFTLIYWIVLIAEMVLRMIPAAWRHRTDFLDIGCSKQFSYNHVPVENFDRNELISSMKKKDVGALKVAGVWFFLAACVLTLKLNGIFKEAELLLIWAICYLLDIICILFYCPLQSLLMKNRCCTTCRIFRWDHFLMYTVFVFVPNFFAVTLFAVSVMELICWEFNRYKHPERFWHGSNENLQCQNCTDKLCEYKKNLRRSVSRLAKN